jgi:hypothetical protein
MTWPGANPGRRGGKPATNRFSHGTALAIAFSWLIFVFALKKYFTMLQSKWERLILNTQQKFELSLIFVY